MLGSKKKSKATEPDELTEKLDRLEMDGMKITKKWIPIWQESLAYFFSDQLKDVRRHKDWDWIIVNYIWPSAMQEMAKLAKTNPKPMCQPWEPSDVNYSEIWQSILNDIWYRTLSPVTTMRLEQIKSILDKKTCGYSVSKVYWEPKPKGCWDDGKKMWYGHVRFRLWHPAEFWGSSEDNLEDGPCGSVRYVDLEWAKSRWPQYTTELEDEAQTYKEAVTAGYGGEYIRGQTASAGTYPSAGYGGIDKGTGTNQPSELLSIINSYDRMSGTSVEFDEDKKMVKLGEIYFYDYEEADQKQQQDVPIDDLLSLGIVKEEKDKLFDRSGKEITSDNWPKRTINKWKQPLYPNGRFILRAGKKILNEDQKWPYTQWPYIVSPHYILPHMWQGVDSVQMYKSTQDMINTTISHLVNNLKQYGDPKLGIETGAIASPPGTHKRHYKVGAGAGAIVRLARNGLARIKYFDPAPVSPGAALLYQIFSQEYKNLSGLQAAGKGEREPGEKTATEIQNLVISSHDRIFLQSLYEEQWARQVMKLSAEVAQKNYEPGRFVRITGENNKLAVVEISQKLKELKFDVDIQVGSAMPLDSEKRIAKFLKAFEILSNPMPNPMTEEMLRALEIPGWQKILEKYSAYQQFYQLYQLYEKVKAGEIAPQEAVRVITQRAMQLYTAEKRSSAKLKEKENAR